MNQSILLLRLKCFKSIFSNISSTKSSLNILKIKMKDNNSERHTEIKKYNLYTFHVKLSAICETKLYLLRTFSLFLTIY